MIEAFDKNAGFDIRVKDESGSGNMLMFVTFRKIYTQQVKIKSKSKSKSDGNRIMSNLGQNR